MSNPLPEPDLEIGTKLVPYENRHFHTIGMAVALGYTEGLRQYWAEEKMHAYAAAEVLAARDCHTCAHYVGGKCWADACTDADRYEALPAVRLWRTTECA